MSSVIVCNCPQNTTDPACLQVVSSRPSNQQQKKPDCRTCWAGSMGRRLDDCWLNVDAGGRHSPRLPTLYYWYHSLQTLCQNRTFQDSISREWNPGTRVPENPGNPPIFKPVNPGLCTLKNPGLTGLVLGVSTACRARKSVHKCILFGFWKFKLQIQSKFNYIFTDEYCLLTNLQ